jgi:hypothetical protein
MKLFSTEEAKKAAAAAQRMTDAEWERLKARILAQKEAA